MKKMICCLFVILELAPARAADPLDTWHKRTSPTEGGLNAVAFANGRFVAVGDRIGVPGDRTAFILSSPDGINWDLHPTQIEKDLSGVAFGNGTFVAIGFGGQAATSPDGMNWTARDTGTRANFNSVRFVNGHFVASGDSGLVHASPNGIEWTGYTTASSNYWNDVTFAGGKYVFVGWDYRSGTARYGVTTDFGSWEIGYTGYGRYLDRVLLVGDRFLAVGYAGAAQTSSDGLEWEPAINASTRWLFDLALGNGTVLAVGESGAIASMAPGSAWVRRASGTTESLRGVAFGQDTFVAVGDEGTILQSDRITGGLVLDEPKRTGSDFLFQLEGEIGQTYQIQTSGDLSAWTQVLSVTCASSPMPCTVPSQTSGHQFYRAVKP
jgi:hypothetical protein